MKINRDDPEMISKIIDWVEQNTPEDEVQHDPKVLELENTVQTLSGVITSLVEGIQGKIASEARIKSLSGFSERYGDKISPYAEPFSKLTNEDLIEKLYDIIDDIKQQAPEFNDEIESGTVDSALSDLKARFEELGIPVQSGDKVVEVEVEPTEVHDEEVAAGEEPPAEEDDDNVSKILKQVEAIQAVKSGKKK